MSKTCFSILFLLLIDLSLPAVVYSQPEDSKRPPDFKWSRGPDRLYQVTKWDATGRVKRIGFIDNAGKLVIDYDRLPSSTRIVGEFHEGRAVIYLDRDAPPGAPAYDVGFIDEAGNMVIPPRFYDARPFSEGLAYVFGPQFSGFIDLQGKPIIKTDGHTRDFHEGLAAVASSEGPWGYIDHSGKVVIRQQYGLADDFSEGLAGVVVDRKFGFINKKGEMVIPPRFTPHRGPYLWDPLVATSRFSDGLAPVTTEDGFGLGKAYGYINHKGEFVIPPQFLFAQLFSEGLAFVATPDPKANQVKKVGWIDKAGQWVVTEVQGLSPGESAKAFSSFGLDHRYSEGLTRFTVYSAEGLPLHGYIDRKGKVIIEPRQYNRIDPFHGGIARVWVRGYEAFPNEDYGYINKTGQFIWRSR
ncbi:MAG TPA: WG repeat-containing protein [Pyrinomonadaceae bacterium]|nr:WG repeat-containing protein [Pyrinomonadaceae bacterium]